MVINIQLVIDLLCYAFIMTVYDKRFFAIGTLYADEVIALDIYYAGGEI